MDLLSADRIADRAGLFLLDKKHIYFNFTVVGCMINSAFKHLNRLLDFL